MNFSFSFVVIFAGLCAFNYPFSDRSLQARLCVGTMIVCLKWLIPSIAGATFLFYRHIAIAGLNASEAADYRWQMAQAAIAMILEICALGSFARRARRNAQPVDFAYLERQKRPRHHRA